MFNPDQQRTTRTRTAWRPEVPRAAAPLYAWLLAALFAPPLLVAAVLALG